MPYLIELDHKTALTLIAGEGCEHFARGQMGHCLTVGHRRIVATFEAEKACSPCVAYAALYPQNVDLVERNACAEPHLVEGSQLGAPTVDQHLGV